MSAQADQLALNASSTEKLRPIEELQAYLRKKPANFVHQKPATEWSNERETRGIGIACAWNRALHA